MDLELGPSVGSIDGVPLRDRMEGNHWYSVMLEIKSILGDDFGGYRFLFHSIPTQGKPEVAEHADPKSVLILLGDNSGEHFADLLDGFFAVFKVHLAGPYRHVYPVPLGTTNMQLYASELPVRERPRNVFYSGNLNANRVDLWRALYFKRAFPKKNLPARRLRSGVHHLIRSLRLPMNFDDVFPESIVRFTSGFKQGMDAESYSRHLAESKICLSPYGFGRAECFRTYEAIKAGAIVITHRLGDNWFVTGGPFVQIERWSELRGLVNSLLSNTSKMEDLQEATIRWWKEKCSPEGVARYIVEKIRETPPPGERSWSETVKPPAHRTYV